MINFDKFLASFITEMKKYQPVTCYNLPGCIKKALDDQGLEYKDGEIVKTQRRISAEAKENGYNMSDDDRIREALIHFFSNSENTSFEYWEGISKKEVLAWLEKQGVHANFRHKIQIDDKVTRNKDGILVNISQLDRVAKKHKKQGKQKPVEWKQENREELTEFENAMMHIGGSFFGENAGLDPNDTNTIKEQAELLLELAPKTEWSEEDEAMYTRTLGVLGKCYMGELPTKVEEELKWFKSIKQRYIRKSSNELDEASYQVGIKRVLENPESYGLTKCNWKPSDEQINSLEYIIDNAQYLPYSHSVVNELLEQLKKLKRG